MKLKTNLHTMGFEAVRQEILDKFEGSLALEIATVQQNEKQLVLKAYTQLSPSGNCLSHTPVDPDTPDYEMDALYLQLHHQGVDQALRLQDTFFQLLSQISD